MTVLTLTFVSLEREKETRQILLLFQCFRKTRKTDLGLTFKIDLRVHVHDRHKVTGYETEHKKVNLANKTRLILLALFTCPFTYSW